MKIPRPGEGKRLIIRSDNTNDDSAHEAMMAAQEKRARSILGLDIVFSTFTPEEKLAFLRSPERIAAFDQMTTTTNPRKAKADQKRGIVSEVLKQHLVDETLLTKYRIVHLGSGIDIEYPLALGARMVEMVDPILESPEAREALLQSITRLTGQPPSMEADGRIVFSFDFGKGPETVTLHIQAQAYRPDAGIELSQEKVAMILGFAAQGPTGEVVIGNDLKALLVEGGIILMGSEVITTNATTKEESVIKLGRKEDSE